MNKVLILFLGLFYTATAQNSYINFVPHTINKKDKVALIESVVKNNSNYDENEKMIVSSLNGYNYHTDATSGRYHNLRSSFVYALDLLDLNDKKYEKRAFEILEKCISLQDTISNSKTKGIWPYYLEEPLISKKSPPDFNWADFNGVTLLDVWMGHQNKIPQKLKPIIKQSLVLAARSIQKRNITMSYTNIAIMGTYVTYLVGHLFDDQDLKQYSSDRLKRFYSFTIEKGGFAEYNSPGYTIVDIDELSRMKEHIVEPSAKQMVDKLYFMAWESIAKHYHIPSGQWVGPHSRSYHTILQNSFYDLIGRSTSGEIQLKAEFANTYSRVKHELPKDLYHYFNEKKYPKYQKEVIEISDPQLVGTNFMTQKFALSTASRSSLWNQRRPFLAYWGSIKNPKYLQLKFLHDFYDFSSASFYSEQIENKVLGAINLNLNCGDKHIIIDQIKSGKFNAKDLRIRFEFGNQKDLVIPKRENDLLSATVDSLHFGLGINKADFDGFGGHWEFGKDENSAYWDFVIYSGVERTFDLNSIQKAVWVFNFSIDENAEQFHQVLPEISELHGMLKSQWQGLTLELSTKILPLPQNVQNQFW